MSRLGFRSRLVVTVLAMVVLVTVALGVASWMLVRGSLRSDLVDSATEQSGFVVGVLAPERFDDDPTAEEIAASPFLTDVRLGPDDVRTVSVIQPLDALARVARNFSERINSMGE